MQNLLLKSPCICLWGWSGAKRNPGVHKTTKAEGKKLWFSLTTNGTLLNGERARFLAENDFNIAISLDGSKKEHDTCRKFPDGSGSFDTVMQNIRDLSRSYLEYTKKSVSFFTTVNPFMDLGCVMEYFKADEIINEKHITYNMMVLKDLKNKQDYQESFFQIQKFEYIKALFSLWVRQWKRGFLLHWDSRGRPFSGQDERHFKHREINRRRM